MTADTSALLWQGLNAARAWESTRPGSREERAAAEQATGALLQLHAELTQGGPLPEPWMKARPHPGGSHISGAMIG